MGRFLASVRVPCLHPPDTPKIISPKQHGIPAISIHPHARYVCHWLQHHGHYAWVVGGAVRDLLMGKHPKDFDVATSAHHDEVKKMFRNARIIGRRFRLALLTFPNMQIEISSFRSSGHPTKTKHSHNTLGTPKEDALHRDFTINAMALDPMTMNIIDYVHAQPDIKTRTIRTITAPEESFHADPVRMIRAVRFEQRLGFTMYEEMRDCIIQLASLLSDIGRHRLNEETQRFLSHGYAVKAFIQFDALGLLEPLLGMEERSVLFAKQAQKNLLGTLQDLLTAMDAFSVEFKEVMSPTVSLLGALFVLTHGSVQHSMLGVSVSVKGSMPYANLHKVLSAWGLLNGQVEPAVQILNTAQSLLTGAKNKRPTVAANQKGVREAWLLLLALRKVLKLDDSFLRVGKKLLPNLPDLPILDHWRMSL